MSCPRSYDEHQPTLTVEYSASTLSRWGFFPVILPYLRRLDLPRRLRGVTIPSAPNAHFQPVDQLMTLVTVFIIGIARISYIDRTLAGASALWPGSWAWTASPPTTRLTPCSARSPPGTSSRWTASTGPTSMSRPDATQVR
jgi:hypothetical protein